MGATITAERVRQDILRLCHAGLDSWRLRIEVFDRLQHVIPGPMYWCSTTDPETLLITGAVMRGIEHVVVPGFISNELRGEDANQFTELAKRKFPVATLYAAMRGDLRRSPRFHELLEPAGQGDEMRAALRAGKSVWGVMCLHRELRDPAFSPKEVAFFAEIAPHLGAGLRVAALLDTLDGDWLALHASRLTSASSAGQIAVILEPARPAEIASLILLAYALTEREAQVAQLVLKGNSTEDIAEALTISELTVQQHLKAIFDKVGVHSRRDLVAQLFARHYWPRIADAAGISHGAWSAEDVGTV